MASILNTDLGDLYDHWNQRVAFNEGYERQKISEARQFGANAFSLGLDRAVARDMYFERRKNLEAEAREFLSFQPAIDVDPKEVFVQRQPDGRFVDVDGEYVKDAAGNDYIEPVGDVIDGEETLGMESVVAGESEDIEGDWYTEAMQDHFESVELEINSVSNYDWAVAHSMNNAMDEGTFEYLDSGGAFGYTG